MKSTCFGGIDLIKIIRPSYLCVILLLCFFNPIMMILYVLREEEMRMVKMQKTKEELQEFRKMQDIWRQKEQEAIEEEDR